MYSDTLVIIPAYNEERTISSVVSSVKVLYQDIDVVVIDDGSHDKTAQLAKKAGAAVLSHPFNMGYGVSLQTGYKYAVRKNYHYVVQMDGDGQHDPGGIETLLQVIKSETSDIALGSRFLGPNTYRPSIFRLIGIRLFRFVLKILSGQDIKDVTTGFQALNRKVLNVFISDIFPCDYPDADVIMLLSKLGFKIEEVPVIMYPKQNAKSMHRNPIEVLYYVFKMFLSMFLTKLRKYNIPGRD